MNEQVKDLNGRFQTEQEVNHVSGTEAETGSNNYTVVEQKRSGSKLKQEIAAQVVAQGKGTSGVDSLANPSAYGKVAGSYSGDGRAVLGNSANTPVLREGHQGDTREAKKLSDANKDINLMASEQYATYFEQPKSLAQDREATVGYNGNPANISARAQKNSGFTPAELTFDRSVDEILVDNAIFTAGQVVSERGNKSSVYPTKTWVKDGAATAKAEAFEDNKAPIRGNFMPHAINVTFGKQNGVVNVTSFSVVEDNISTDVTGHEIVNDSSANDTIAANRAELARQAIDNDHGAPTSPKYNPLGRSVSQPTATVQYLMDIEANTGAIMTSAIRHANKAKAYYLNRVGKDGIVQEAPAVDALYGHIVGNVDNATMMSRFGSYYSADNTECPYYNTELNKLGSAAILLKVFDSLGKYKTKADIVNQPRGLKLPLQTGINNVNPFHVDEAFIKALNSIDVFSTIDRGYDPSAPVCISDGLAYVMPYSWARSLSFVRTSTTGPREYSSELFAYAYQAGNGNQRYYVKVGEPILNGIAWFLEQYAPSFFSALGGKNNGDTVNLSIPVRSYTTHFSLFDYIICASSAYILYERTNTMKDILDEEMHSGYPFPHLVGLSKDIILNPTNYGTISPFDRLAVKEMKPASAMRWIIPELFMPIGDADQMLPWYYAGSDFEKGSSATALIQKDEPSHIPVPVIRSGVALSYLDDFYSMTLKDQVLAIDKMTTVPGKMSREEFTGVFYKYGVDSEAMIIVKGATLNALNLLKTPRQIGWTMPVPYGVCRVTTPGLTLITDEEDDKKVISAAYYGENFLQGINGFNSSFRARAYSGLYGEAPTAPLQNEVVNINRGQAFAQKWAMAYANRVETDSTAFPVPLSVANGFVANSDGTLKTVVNATSFRPFITPNGVAVASGNTLFAMMRVLWARIQKLPFVLNPFDSGANSSAVGHVDPFDFAYMLGLSGFMPVTYFEEMSNRMSDKYAKMFNFTEDPYFADSPLYN